MKWNDFVLAVVDSTRVAENILRLEFGIESDAGLGYVPIEPGDEAIVFYFSEDGEPLRTRPSADPAALGGWEIIDPERGAEQRNYTVRSFDATTGRMIVDIAEHGHGPAIEWFRAARPGWRVLAAGPRSWYAPPPDATRHLLVGDLASLPAIARILEATAPSIDVTVIAEVLHPSEIDYLGARSGTRIIELLGSGNGVAPSAIPDAVRQAAPRADSYVWFAGEAADTRAVKKQLRADGLPRERADIVGYWRFNAEEWTKRFEAAGADELRKVFTDALAAGKTRDEATDLYEHALERRGL